MSLIAIFGGCCSNVFTLEAIVNRHRHATLLITFAQFATLALLSLPSQLEGFRLKQRVVPLFTWVTFVALFWGSSLLTNYALTSVSMPLQYVSCFIPPNSIIFRSSGIGVAMLFGYLLDNAFYTRMQVPLPFHLSSFWILFRLVSYPLCFDFDFGSYIPLDFWSWARYYWHYLCYVCFKYFNFFIFPIISRFLPRHTHALYGCSRIISSRHPPFPLTYRHPPTKDVL